MHRHTEFLSPAYYMSMGFGIPAAVGASMANPRARILVVVGDGAFQMTGMELSTIVRYGLNPIVVVLNNHGYTTERFLLDGSFNDLQEWAYHKIPDILGGGLGLEVSTVADLEAGLLAALDHTAGFSLLNVHLDTYDRSPALERLANRLSKLVSHPVTDHGDLVNETGSRSHSADAERCARGETTYPVKRPLIWIEHPEISPIWTRDAALRRGEEAILCIQMGDPERPTLVEGTAGDIRLRDIPEHGLETEWVVSSQTVSLRAVDELVAVEVSGGVWLARFRLHVPRRGYSVIRRLGITPLQVADEHSLSVVVCAIITRGREELSEIYRRFSVPLPVEAVHLTKANP
jgi:hypothetical protein